MSKDEVKKRVVTSNLCLRFYMRDGWTKEELDALCDKGEVLCSHPHDIYPYYTLNVGSRFNPDKLMEKAIIERTFTYQMELSDRELIISMNWGH